MNELNVHFNDKNTAQIKMIAKVLRIPDENVLQHALNNYFEYLKGNEEFQRLLSFEIEVMLAKYKPILKALEPFVEDVTNHGKWKCTHCDLPVYLEMNHDTPAEAFGHMVWKHKETKNRVCGPVNGLNVNTANPTLVEE